MDEEAISAELISKGEERKEQKKVSKNKLVGFVEADAKMRDMMVKTMENVAEEIRKSSQNIENLQCSLTDNLEVDSLFKHRKIELLEKQLSK